MSANFVALRQIWQQAFEDPAEIPDAFFATGFSEDRFHCIRQGGKPVSVLYWFDCQLNGQKLAYLYAVATEEKHRGRGHARKLMDQTHQILKENSYAGAILVPGEESLFAFYEQLGYRTVCSVNTFSCTWGDEPVAMREIEATEYARLRRGYLPAGGVVQEGAVLEFLQTQVGFYAGEDFLLAASVQENALVAQELLGNAGAAPGILRALGAPQGQFRTPGMGKFFAMLLPLQEDCPVPNYFGLALD